MVVKKNQTVVTEFLLLGFGDLHDLKILLFAFLLIIYVMALTGNALVIVLVVISQNLHSPMYIFLSQLSLSEILFTSNILPGMLWLTLEGGGKIPIIRCFSHLYLLTVCTITQCLLLTTMSFDRYVAICKPLNYTVIMTFGLQLQIVTLCWSSGFTLSIVLFVFLYRLEFCGPDTINHFYCDVGPVLELSCSDISSVKLVTSMLSTPLLLCPFVFIMATYISIFNTILKMSSSIRRQKAFSTCSSHLTVVCLYFGSLASIYVFSPKLSSSNVNKNLSLIYILVTPLFNPLIYSLRNQDIRGAITKYIHLIGTWQLR
ncbi:olfactory receptor 10A3-like [Rana temporaria]|uniref:olfactory receptor 10A3-like n=1 Tax=Rana temporaria TaxID=8407 RepID=UPI001AACD55B|nr:olfactory receptor 10A3-like [Rana temporaria]